MNPTLPYKKHSLSTRKQIETMLRKQARQHQKSNSMMDFLHIKGNDHQHDSSQRVQKQTSSSRQETVEQLVEKEFLALKQRIQIYCKNSNKFVQHQQIERSIQQGRCASSFVSVGDIFSLILVRIREFMTDSDLPSTEKQFSPNKLPFPPSISQSFNVQSLSMAGQTEDLQRIQNIEVLQVYNNSRNERKRSEQKLPSPSSLESELEQQISATRINYTSSFINSLPIACSSTLSEILYKEAQLRNFSQFHKFCQKVLLEKKPIISDFHFFKREKLQKTNFYLGDICRKLNILNTKLTLTATGGMSLVRRESYCSSEDKDKGKDIGQEIDSICMILKKLNQLHNLNSLVFDCSRPCCKSQEGGRATSTKAKILLNLKQSAKKSLHYNTQITEEYFNRYYRNESFDRTRIYSLTKTKTEEMERLEKSYYKMKSNKKACRKRCHSLFDNIA